MAPCGVDGREELVDGRAPLDVLGRDPLEVEGRPAPPRASEVVDDPPSGLDESELPGGGVGGRLAVRSSSFSETRFGSTTVFLTTERKLGFRPLEGARRSGAQEKEIGVRTCVHVEGQSYACQNERTLLVESGTDLLSRDDLPRGRDPIVDLVLELPLEQTLVLSTLERVDAVCLDDQVALSREEVLGVVVRERQPAEDGRLVQHLGESSRGRSLSVSWWARGSERERGERDWRLTA